jgi:hypothetical protein
LSVEIERNLDIISENPLIFSRTEKLDIRKVVIAKFNTLYYKIENEKIKIISFFQIDKILAIGNLIKKSFFEVYKIILNFENNAEILYWKNILEMNL